MAQTQQGGDLCASMRSAGSMGRTNEIVVDVRSQISERSTYVINEGAFRPPPNHLQRNWSRTIEWRLTNGIAESNNAAIGRIRANARGFHDPHAFITMTMLDRAGIGPNLPWTTVS